MSQPPLAKPLAKPQAQPRRGSRGGARRGGHAGDALSLPLRPSGCDPPRRQRVRVQGGDIVRGDGQSGASIYGGFFADEGFEAKHGEPGLLGMANQGRDTNRSQFYITTSACPHLDGRHVVFGKVLEGMDHVRKVEALQTASGSERPSVAVSISDCGELQQSVPVH